MKELMRELDLIKPYIPRQTYLTIMGQMRAGDMGGATVGIARLRRKIFKEDGHENSNCKQSDG